MNKISLRKELNLKRYLLQRFIHGPSNRMF